MFNLERLAYAMAEHEGWKPNANGVENSGSRSFRNHNPGNLRASPSEVGKVGGFAIFKTDADGFKALMWDIEQKARGKTTTGLNGQSTLKQLINVWAPAADNNDPNSYLNHICKMTGFSPDTKLAELLK